MRPVTHPRFALAAVAAAFLAASCAGAAPGGGASGATGPVLPAANATTAPLLPTDALALPELDLAAYGRLIDQLHGTPVVVNFWGSWCGPCRDEAAQLAAAHHRFGDRVQFLGVDILDARESARGFMHEFGWTYPSVFDPGGAIRDGLGLLGQPVTLFYDRNGQIADRWIGPIPQDELRIRVERLVAG